MTDHPYDLGPDDRLRLLAQKAFDASTRRGVMGVAAWTGFLAEARRTVNHYRGHEVADLMFLDGFGLREIQEHVEHLAEEPITYQGIQDWVKRHGPAAYLAVRRDGGRYRTKQVPVLGTIQTRRELSGLRADGWRVVPARWEVTTATAAQAEGLWHRLGEQP